VEKPVIAIGSVTADRVAALLEAGAHGVAVISAVVCQVDPAAAAREFRQAIDAWLGMRVS
jgi:thiamine-phosphate pyrophosphorylase